MPERAMAPEEVDLRTTGLETIRIADDLTSTHT